MKAECYGGSQSVHAQAAVLLYGARHQHSVYATVHEVQEVGGKLVMEAGVPATASGLRKVFAGLDPEKVHGPVFLPPHVLAKGSEWLVWWVPPANRYVYFDCKEFGGKVSANVPHPGLVFAVTSNQWQVFAVAGRQRPDEDATLYQAPYFNVWSSGQVCVGSAPIPREDRWKDTGQWESAFFCSYFSHPNIQGLNTIIKHPRGRMPSGRKCWKGSTNTFPKAAWCRGEP